MITRRVITRRHFMRMMQRVLQAAAPPGTAAQRFTSMLLEKVLALDDFAPSEPPAWLPQLRELSRGREQPALQSTGGHGGHAVVSRQRSGMLR